MLSFKNIFIEIMSFLRHWIRKNHHRRLVHVKFLTCDRWCLMPFDHSHLVITTNARCFVKRFIVRRSKSVMLFSGCLVERAIILRCLVIFGQWNIMSRCLKKARAFLKMNWENFQSVYEANPSIAARTKKKRKMSIVLKK